MTIRYDREQDALIGRERVHEQTIEIILEQLGITGNTTYFNIALSVYNKRKHSSMNEDKKLITGKYPFETVVTGLKLFDAMEKECLDRFFYGGINLAIICSWVDNRRRDAYYKILHKRGYDWGIYEGEKVIMKEWKF